MKIVADENIALVHEVFGGVGEVVTCPGRDMQPALVKDADVLLVRSVTPVGRALLEGSQVRFVGTCTIGTDHIDQAYLAQRGIAFSAAPGCNANAVVDYVISALVKLALTQGFELADRTVGIIGLGNVGSCLRNRLVQIGVRCLCNDPLLEPAAEEPLVSKAQVLAEADVISLHTPLTRRGPHATYHLFDEVCLSGLKESAILINTGRGAVVDNQALLRLLNRRADVSAVLDVWEQEPEILAALLQRVAIGTPHIAGYSLDGKIAGTMMIYEAVCDFLALPKHQDFSTLIPEAPAVCVPSMGDSGAGLSAYLTVQTAYDIARDDLALKQTLKLPAEARAQAFDRLRKAYPVRREFRVTPVRYPAGQPALAGLLAGLGFSL